MNLSNVYIMMDDTVPEQKHLELVFVFEDSKQYLHEYAIQFNTGMPLEEFKQFAKTFNELVQTSKPTPLN